MVLRPAGKVAPDAFAAAQTIVEKYPLPEQNPKPEFFARAYMIHAFNLAEKQGKYDEALKLLTRYISASPTPTPSFCDGQLDLLLLRYSLHQGVKPEDALALAQGATERIHNVAMTLTNWWEGGDEPQHVQVIADMYKHSSQPQLAVQFVTELPLFNPPFIRIPHYFTTVVPVILQQGKRDEAVQMAYWSFRVCPFNQVNVFESTELISRTLMATGNGAKIEPFLAFLKTGQGDNPLATMSPKFTADQVQQMEVATGGLFAREVDGNLYVGRWDQALKAAQGEMVSPNVNQATALADIARCFKAKDMNTIRANQYLEWLKTSQGPNPVEAF